MQVGNMARVEVPLVPLQIIALVEDLCRPALLLRHAQELVSRHQRRGARPHVRQDEVAHLPTRISMMPNPVLEGTIRGLSRLVDAPAREVIKPPVVQTPQTAAFHTAVAQVRSAVGAVQTEQSWSPLLIPEKRQILAQQPYRPGMCTGRQLL